MENLNLALTLLLAGFVIVFLVLVLLILIITVYGKIIQFAQKAVSNKASQNKKCKAFPFHSFFLGQCGHC